MSDFNSVFKVIVESLVVLFYDNNTCRRFDCFAELRFLVEVIVFVVYF